VNRLSRQLSLLCLALLVAGGFAAPRLGCRHSVRPYRVVRTQRTGPHSGLCKPAQDPNTSGTPLDDSASFLRSRRRRLDSLLGRSFQTTPAAVWAVRASALAVPPPEKGALAGQASDPSPFTAFRGPLWGRAPPLC